MKHIIKKALPYIIALVIGVVVMFLIMPTVKAHRENPSLIGGEILIPFVAVGGTFMVRSIYRDIKSGMFSADEEDDE